ncbi:hypothetical protein Ddc_00096 [Ditylenchus destructor]|nr:hypothetical protein Ddc_00096 [Ditylenchus destructor]
MYYTLMMNILRNFSRDDLEIVSISTRLASKIVEKEFTAYPCRSFDELCIRATYPISDLELCLSNSHVQLLPDRSNIAEFKSRNGGNMHDIDYFGFDEMLPFVGKSIRFKKTTIYLMSDARITPQHIAQIESISHLWADQSLTIERFPFHTTPGIMQDCSLILNSLAAIQPCRRLRLRDLALPFSEYHNLYSLKIVEFCPMGTAIPDNHVLSFIEGIGKCRSKTLTVWFLYPTYLRTHITKIREAFMAAREPISFEVFFVQKSIDDTSIAGFRDENLSTKEVLEMPVVWAEEKFNFLNKLYGNGFHLTYDIFCLKRRPI